MRHIVVAAMPGDEGHSPGAAAATAAAIAAGEIAAEEKFDEGIVGEEAVDEVEKDLQREAAADKGRWSNLVEAQNA